MTWQLEILTLFPEMFPGALGHSIAGKALAAGKWRYNTHNIRDFANGPHQMVDDRPFGGGVGMILRPDVMAAAIDHILAQKPVAKIIYFSPRGKLLTQQELQNLAQISPLLLICGRYEAIDERVLAEYEIYEYSIGDYVLSGGELPALCFADACIRLLPGVLKKTAAYDDESFGGQGKNSFLLEYPHYTRPAEWRGKAVPEVLLSGNHAKIADWRNKQAMAITQVRRPDLWRNYLDIKNNERE